MRIVKIFFLSVVIFALSLATYLYFYLGVYKSAGDVRVETVGPLLLVYKAHTGAYHQIGPAIQEVEEWAMKQNILCPRTFGEYLDDPDAVDQDRLRSRGGCVLTAVPVDVPAQFTFETRAPHRYAIADFNGSPSIGHFKVYPKVKEYLAKERLRSQDAVIEIYKVNGKNVTTEFLFPLVVPTTDAPQ